MEASEAPVSPAHMQSMLRQLRRESMLVTLPVLSIAGFVLFSSEHRFRDPQQAALPGLALFVLPLTVWILQRRSYLASAWALAAGVSAVDLLIVALTGTAAPIHLLALAAGLASLLVGPAGGVLAASACTCLMAFAPPALLAADPVLRITTVIGTWGTVGLVWLTTRPLVTTLQWSWSSYEHSRRLLEQARDYQVQLKQGLADLADANRQLTRLNRLAQGLRQAAEEARRAKEQFVANVSHELRTPLNMIIGFSEMIVKAPQVYGNPVPSGLLADLAVILRNSQHLASLIDDVLDLSQIEAGKMALTKERVALGEILEAAATAVRPLFESKGLCLRTEVAEDLPLVLCDRTRIREVVLNLLSNAGRFTERGGVQVRAERLGSDVAVHVADTGPGIPAEYADRLFEPFQQLDGSLRRRYGGSGLGLAISKSFVELHGGRMWLETQVGSGTTFSFTLPVEPPLPADSEVSRWFGPYWHYEERTRRSSAPPAIVRPRFVVLELDRSLEQLLTRYRDGIEVVPAGSTTEAMQELARVPAQALLVNGSSVAEALEQIGQQGPLPYGAPAIICSVPGSQVAADALGTSSYLVKPISRDALLAALARLPLKGRTVLVVDDEPEAARLFQRMLAWAEPAYRVLRARNGREALEILREESVDAILLDLVMPDMDGFRFLEVRGQDATLQEIPVVVISARDPAGQLVVSDTLAVTRHGGLSMPQLLACIDAISSILSPSGQPVDPARPGTPPG